MHLDFTAHEFDKPVMQMYCDKSLCFKLGSKFAMTDLAAGSLRRQVKSSVSNACHSDCLWVAFAQASSVANSKGFNDCKLCICTHTPHRCKHLLLSHVYAVLKSLAVLCLQKHSWAATHESFAASG